MTRGKPVVSIIGATGLVGSEIARVLTARKFPCRKLLLYASGRQAEINVSINGNAFKINKFRLADIADSQVCFLAAGGDFARRYAWPISRLGAVVIDNSSAWRMHREVPLVVPEVNAADVKKHRGLIANPNCSTIQMVMALAPLHRAWRLRRIVVSTYQAVSGAGLSAAGELATQSDAVLGGEDARARVFGHRIAFNLIPHIDSFDRKGWTREERKMMDETRKILGDRSIQTIATAVRVPVFRGHSESVHAEFERRVSVEKARRMLENAPGVSLVDDPGKGRYPMPKDCAGTDATLVGRLRSDPGCARALCMWIVSDNLRKGAALNAVQIAELL